MKIYTVMPGLATITDSDDATVFLRVHFEPEVFTEECEAVDAAQRLARQNPGVSVWIAEGVASRSFQCEPLPVVETSPKIQCMA